MTPRTGPRLLLAVAVTYAAALALASCGGDDGGDATAEGAAPGEIVAGEPAPGVPEECAAPFPTAMGSATLDDVELLPAGWPEPPVEATLCITSATIDESQAIIDYATETAPADVLDAYQTLLAGLGSVESTEDGLGRPILTGVAEGQGYQVSAKDGSFRIVFAAG